MLVVCDKKVAEVAEVDRILSIIAICPLVENGESAFSGHIFAFPPFCTISTSITVVISISVVSTSISPIMCDYYY